MSHAFNIPKILVTRLDKYCKQNKKDKNDVVHLCLDLLLHESITEKPPNYKDKNNINFSFEKYPKMYLLNGLKKKYGGQKSDLISLALARIFGEPIEGINNDSLISYTDASSITLIIAAALPNVSTTLKNGKKFGTIILARHELLDLEYFPLTSHTKVGRYIAMKLLEENRKKAEENQLDDYSYDILDFC